MGAEGVENAESLEGLENHELIDARAGRMEELVVAFENQDRDASLSEAEGDQEAYRAGAHDDDGFVFLSRVRIRSGVMSPDVGASFHLPSGKCPLLFT